MTAIRRANTAAPSDGRNAGRADGSAAGLTGDPLRGADGDVVAGDGVAFGIAGDVDDVAVGGPTRSELRGVGGEPVADPPAVGDLVDLEPVGGGGRAGVGGDGPVVAL